MNNIWDQIGDLLDSPTNPCGSSSWPRFGSKMAQLGSKLDSSWRKKLTKSGSETPCKTRVPDIKTT